jgi:hypothetical protein
MAVKSFITLGPDHYNNRAVVTTGWGSTNFKLDFYSNFFGMSTRANPMKLFTAVIYGAYPS